MSGTVLFEDDFSGFPPGLFSADVGPHTEYHYLPEAAPKGGWSVASFASREAGLAWHIEDIDGRRYLRQTQYNKHLHTHPMLCVGDPLWGDAAVEARVTPEVDRVRCGIVFRYRNNRCYDFFGFDGDRVVLIRVRHEAEFHVPDEVVLAEARFERRPFTEYRLSAGATGGSLTGSVDGVELLSARGGTYGAGKAGLLADDVTRFAGIRVTATESAGEAFAILRSRRERELADLQAANPKPVLWKRFSTEGFGAARNLRFGDLTGNGEMDLVIGQITHHGPRDAYSEVGCITAMTFDGDILWQSGEPDPAKHHLTNDVAFQVHDIDGDGRAEVVYARDFELVVADGATGQVKYSAPTPESRPPADRYPRILGDCLFFCDLRGTGRAADVIIKDRYWHLWALNDRLEPMWEQECKTGHYPYAYDVDGDGRDELAMGYALFDDDGTQLWNLEDVLPDHADGIAITNFQEASDSVPKILYAGSDAGLILVGLDGEILRNHLIGHAQNPVIARFRSDLPGLQAVSINFWGNQGLLHFYDGHGEIYHDAEPLNMGSMCLPINWTGRDEEFFVLNPNPRHGGMYDGWGWPVVMFPDDGHPDMCYSVLDVTGDCRDEVIVWDQREVWVYTQSDSPREGRLHRPDRNPLCNSSNYQASVSLPGWSG